MPLNFGSYSHLNHKDPKTEYFNFTALFSFNIKWPHLLAMTSRSKLVT